MVRLNKAPAAPSSRHFPKLSLKPRLIFFFLGLVFLISGCVDLPVVDLSPDQPIESEEESQSASPTSALEGDAAAQIPTAVPTTAAPTSTPLPPTPTPDPNLPEWTILVYMAADNDLDPQAIFNINQLEETGSSVDVNVVVQIDRAARAEWSDARRYFITRDEDPQQISSTLLEELGEINSGEAQTLADFILWGRAAYPAQNTALILWNHGIGWSGIATDETDQNMLTLPELEQALTDSMGDERLSLVGFDACLMGQLDVYAALAPFADVAVASEELTPAQGWPYDEWLAGLQANPDQSPAELGTQSVSQFIATYGTTHPFSTMAAVDLRRIDPVVEKFQKIIELGQTDLAIAATDLTLARSGADQFARAYGIESDRFAAVDLGHLSGLLSSRAVSQPLQAAGAELSASIEEAVITAGAGRGFQNASGIAIYFPTRTDAIDPRYEIQGAMPAWSELLPALLTENAADLSLPQLTVSSDSLNQTAGVLNPIYLEFQITGRQIEQVDLIAGRYDPETGRRLLLEIDPLLPEPTYLADGSQVFAWRDGLHEDFFVWNTRVTYLSDGTNGQFVIMWPLDETNPTEPLRTVAGTYISAPTSQTWRANLVFNTDTGQIVQAWATGGGGAPFEFDPVGGDFFEADRYFLNDANAVVAEPGVRLVLDENAQLVYDWRPVNSGDYFIGFQVVNPAGVSPQSLVDITVENPDTTAPWQAYLDPYLGFQFLYPAEWYRPVYSGDRLFTTSANGETTLQVVLFPDLAGLTQEALQSQALEGFGLTTGNILYRDPLTIDGRPAERIAYSYTGGEGERVGEMTAFIRDGIGFVIDLDGPAEAESETIIIWERLVNNWAYLPVGRGLFPNRWAEIELAELSVIRPEAFVYEPAAAGWERFSLPEDSRIFMALNVTSGSGGDTPTGLLDRWTSVAESGVNDFAIFEPATRRFALGGRLWFRRDFSYIDGSGDTIWGFLMVTQEGDKLITAWTEAPQNRYADTEGAVFEVMLAELQTVAR